MDESFKLSASQHERIYKEIEADVLGSSTPVANPRVIITGGQPGSGKSRLLESSKAEFPDGNVVVIKLCPEIPCLWKIVKQFAKNCQINRQKVGKIIREVTCHAAARSFQYFLWRIRARS